MEKKERNSNFELMRIVSMILIVIYHILLHGDIISKVSGTNEIILRIIMSLCVVHVSSYILLTGYFQYDKKMRFSKVISLNNSAWFYTLLFSIIAFSCGIKMTSLEIFKDIVPLVQPYWFFMLYMILYLISPILNSVILTSDKKKLKSIIILLLFITSILPYVTNEEFLAINKGYSLYYFIFLYFIGAYLHKYPIKDSYHFKNVTNNSYKLIFIFMYIIFSFLNVQLLIYSYQLRTNNIFEFFSKIIEGNFLAYNNPLILLATLSYFLFFENLNIKSKIINTLATTAFGTYLIHDNIHVRKYLYDFLNLDKFIDSLQIIPIVFLTAILIYLVCFIIEKSRQILFKLVYNTKLAKWNRQKYRGFIKSLNIDINW